MRTDELSGMDLDQWVAKAEGVELEPNTTRIVGTLTTFRPSRDWNQGGPIIERELIKLEPCYNMRGELQYWDAKSRKWEQGYTGETALVAAMRAYVGSKFGEVLPDPAPAT